MRNRLACAALALLLAASCASAWGAFTSKYICRESVKYVWGTDVIAECFPPKADTLSAFCQSTYDLMGDR
jgi:hypothetical protein